MAALGAAILLPGSSTAQYLTIGKYREIFIAAGSDKNAEATLYIFLAGFWNMVVETSDADARLGTKPAFCLPRGFLLNDLRHEIQTVLAIGSERWKPQDSIGAVVLIAMEQRWPCK